MTETYAIIVAAHKRYEMPSDKFYIPVHVGHALNPIDLGYQPDDEGDNISQHNTSYCELTALYWAWKNLNIDVIGLNHYRRYFRGELQGPNGSRILSKVEAQRLMNRYDVILAKPRNYYIESIDSHYRKSHYGSDLDLLRTIISQKEPQYLSAFDRVFRGTRASLYNMFIMRKDTLGVYAEWLFGILSEVEMEIDNESRSSFQKRTFGFLGERLLNVWILAKSEDPEFSAITLPVVNTEGEPKFIKTMGLLWRKFARAYPK